MPLLVDVFFFNDTATTEIYTLSLHDALPIFQERLRACLENPAYGSGDDWLIVEDLYIQFLRPAGTVPHKSDRKSTRLNSSHANISYAVFCLKKKKKSA